MSYRSVIRMLLFFVLTLLRSVVTRSIFSATSSCSRREHCIASCRKRVALCNLFCNINVAKSKRPGVLQLATQFFIVSRQVVNWIRGGGAPGKQFLRNLLRNGLALTLLAGKIAWCKSTFSFNVYILTNLVSEN